jgi:hypothetical protein
MRWTEVDRAKAIAFTLEKAERCVMCGTAEWEWDPERGGHKHAYEAVTKFCMGCYMKAVLSRDDDQSDGQTIELLPTSGREAAQRHVAARRNYLSKAQS